MDTPVIRDNSDDDASAAPHAAFPARTEAAAHERSQRRFAFDPASSPVLVAALAWDAAVAR